MRSSTQPEEKTTQALTLREHKTVEFPGLSNVTDDTRVIACAFIDNQTIAISFALSEKDYNGLSYVSGPIHLWDIYQDKFIKTLNVKLAKNKLGHVLRDLIHLQMGHF